MTPNEVFGKLAMAFEEVVVRGRPSTVVCVIAILLSAVIAAEESNPRPDSAPGSKATTAYVVVLADGSMLPAKSKPLSAFGSFRFVDVSGRTRVLPVSKIDLEATRAANAGVPDDPRRGTLSVAGPAINEPPKLVDDDQQGNEEPKVKSVTVYSATWCGYCKDLKRYLSARKIPANIIEVDRLPPDQQHSATATMKRLTGRVAYPTVVIGGEAHAGFSKAWIESTLGR